MRIVHVVPLMTPDGAFGGPVTVAVGQAQELARRGHDVQIVAGYSGFEEPPTDLDGVRLHAFKVARVLPRTGFAGLYSTGLLRHMFRAASRADVVHVHMARDLITAPAAAVAARSGARLVIQPHGMIDRSDRRLASFLDAVLVRRTMQSATCVLTLTETEADELANLHMTTKTRAIPNGIVAQPSGERRPRPRPEVLFLARLHPRKRVLAFARAAQTLAGDYPHVDFVVVGPDEGDGDELRALLEGPDRQPTVTFQGALPPQAARSRIAGASIYVLPSVGEVFPMTVLEALAAARPVVITHSNGLAPALNDARAAAVIGLDDDDLVTALRGLLDRPEAADEMGQRGQTHVMTNWSMSVVGDELESVYAGKVVDR